MNTSNTHLKSMEHKIIFIYNHSCYHFATITLENDIYFSPTVKIVGSGINQCLPINIENLEHISWHQSGRIHLKDTKSTGVDRIIFNNGISESSPKNPNLESCSEIDKRLFHQLLEVYIANIHSLPSIDSNLSTERDIFLSFNQDNELIFKFIMGIKELALDPILLDKALLDCGLHIDVTQDLLACSFLEGSFSNSKNKILFQFTIQKYVGPTIVDDFHFQINPDSGITY